MRHQWPVRNCVICGGMINHYSKGGLLLDKDKYTTRKACNKAACLSELKSRIQKPLPLAKQCKNCRKMISLCWASGLRKSKGQLAKQKFHSPKCWALWRETRRQPVAKTLERINYIPTTSAERFISRRVA